jgi:hypothetical protein
VHHFVILITEENDLPALPLSSGQVPWSTVLEKPDNLSTNYRLLWNLKAHYHWTVSEDS